MAYRFHRVAINGTGDQDIAISGGGVGTPIAAMFFMNTCTVNGTEASHGMLMAGATDGTHHRCILASMEDAVSTTNAWNKAVNDKPVFTININTGEINWSASFVSFIEGGVRLNYSGAPPAGYFLNCIFLVEEGTGWDAEVVEVDDTDTSITVAAGMPDQIFAAGLASSSGFTAASSTSSDNGAYMSVGFLDKGASVVQGSIGWTYQDGVSGGNNSDNIIKNNAILADADLMLAEFTPTSTGFDVNGSQFFAWALAVKYNGNNSHSSGEFESRTTTGSQSVTVGAYQPAFVMELQSILSAYNSASDTDGFCATFAFFHNDTNNDHMVTLRAITPSTIVARSRASQNSGGILKNPSDSGGGGSLVTKSFTSFDSGGTYTVNYTTVNATARKGLWLAVGPAPASSIVVITRLHQQRRS